jgi:hypothetical protein
VYTPGPGPTSSTLIPGVIPVRFNICSGVPKSRERKGVVSTGAKRESIGHGTALRDIRTITCCSTKMDTTPNTIRLSQRKGLVLDANTGTTPPKTLPYDGDTTTELGSCKKPVRRVEIGSPLTVLPSGRSRHERRGFELLG